MYWFFTDNKHSKNWKEERDDKSVKTKERHKLSTQSYTQRKEENSESYLLATYPKQS